MTQRQAKIRRLAITALERAFPNMKNAEVDEVIGYEGYSHVTGKMLLDAQRSPIAETEVWAPFHVKVRLIDN